MCSFFVGFPVIFLECFDYNPGKLDNCQFSRYCLRLSDIPQIYSRFYLEQPCVAAMGLCYRPDLPCQRQSTRHSQNKKCRNHFKMTNTSVLISNGGVRLSLEMVHPDDTRFSWHCCCFLCAVFRWDAERHWPTFRMLDFLRLGSLYWRFRTFSFRSVLASRFLCQLIISEVIWWFLHVVLEIRYFYRQFSHSCFCRLLFVFWYFRWRPGCLTCCFFSHPSTFAVLNLLMNFRRCFSKVIHLTIGGNIDDLNRRWPLSLFLSVFLGICSFTPIPFINQLLSLDFAQSFSNWS